MEDNKATNNTTENVKASKTKDKGIMSVPQALSCLEVAMKWQTGFKKVSKFHILLIFRNAMLLLIFSGNYCGYFYRI